MLINNDLKYFSYLSHLEIKCEKDQHKPIEVFNIKVKEFSVIAHDQLQTQFLVFWMLKDINFKSTCLFALGPQTKDNIIF